jgi:hypothetical protein
MSLDLTKDFLFFKEHHNEIFEKYPNMFVVIQREAVLFARKTFDEAYNEAIKNGLELGSFLIQECTAGDSAYTQFFTNQIAFA